MGAERFVPADADLDELRAAAASCRGCDLYENATRTVFGAGPADARLVIVGEVPGDQEDRKGEPFVGPAGQLLDRALDEAGIDRSLVYVTNAVKHFKFVPAERGKRRIHKTPSRTEVVACRPWLDAEFDSVGPELVVALGATAAKSLLGRTSGLPSSAARSCRCPTARSGWWRRSTRRRCCAPTTVRRPTRVCWPTSRSRRRPWVSGPRGGSAASGAGPAC